LSPCAHHSRSMVPNGCSFSLAHFSPIANRSHPTPSCWYSKLDAQCSFSYPAGLPRLQIWMTCRLFRWLDAGWLASFLAHFRAGLLASRQLDGSEKQKQEEFSISFSIALLVVVVVGQEKLADFLEAEASLQRLSSCQCARLHEFRLPRPKPPGHCNSLQLHCNPAPVGKSKIKRPSLKRRAQLLWPLLSFSSFFFFISNLFSCSSSSPQADDAPSYSASSL